MKLNMVMVAFCVTIIGGLWLAQPPVTQAQGRTDGIRVSATAYTCDVHPRNPMSGCRRLRWGGNVNNPGMACPYSWRNRHFVVEGFGTLRCDDTGRYDTWNGRPHIDIRVSTWEAARDWGVRTMTIYPADSTSATGPTGPTGPAGTTASATNPARPATGSPSDPLVLAKAAVPRGDTSTAVVRRVRYETALQTLPWLGEVARAPGSQSVWLVTLWQPRDILPADATPFPNRDEPIATTLVVLDAGNGAVLGQTHIAMGALNAIGSLPQDGGVQ